MPKAILQQVVCEKCGFDVRENTAFCYNCGSTVALSETVLEPEPENPKPKVDAATQAALDDLAEKFRIDEDPGDKLSKAATERRKARFNQRKPKELMWEPADDSSSVLLFFLALIIAGLAAIVVFVMVYWK